METQTGSTLLELVIVEGEQNALLAALKMCRGDWPDAYKGWEDEEHQRCLGTLLKVVEDIQLQYDPPWHPDQDKGVYAGQLVFSRELKRFLVDALRLYVGGFPEKYEGAQYWRKEAVFLIYKLGAVGC